MITKCGKKEQYENRLSNKRAWKSASGNIRICDMKDKHLLNTIKFLKEKAEKEASKNENMDYQEQTWMDFVEPVYWNMEEEAYNRKLEF